MYYKNYTDDEERWPVLTFKDEDGVIRVNSDLYEHNISDKIIQVLAIRLYKYEHPTSESQVDEVTDDKIQQPFIDTTKTSYDIGDYGYLICDENNNM